jgi:hypothetical protein
MKELPTATASSSLQVPLLARVQFLVGGEEPKRDSSVSRCGTVKQIHSHRSPLVTALRNCVLLILMYEEMCGWKVC